MKVKVKSTAFYNNKLIKPGTILDYEGKTLPNWAVVADAGEIIAKNRLQKAVQTTKPDKKKQTKKDAASAIPQTPEKEQIPSAEPDTIPSNEPDECALIDELENLKTQALTLNITIEDTETKTLQEQIDELKTAVAQVLE